MTILGSMWDRSLYFLEQRRAVLARLAIVLGLFVLVTAIGLILSPYAEMLVLGLGGSVGLVGLLILYRLSRFEYGILAIALTAGLLNFFTLPTGTESRVVLSLVITIILVAVWFLQLFFRNSGVQLESTPVNGPIFGFIVVSLVAYVWSMALRDTLVVVWDSFPIVQLAALAVNILLPLLSLMVANKIKEERWLYFLAWIVIGIGAFAIFSELFGLPLNTLYKNGTRGGFIVWTSMMALGLALFEQRLPAWMRLGLLGLPLAWFYYTFVQHAFFLSGWMPMLMASLVIIFLRSRRLFLVTLLMVGVVMSIYSEQLYNRIIVSNQREGSTQRLDLWRTNLRLLARHPLFGTGPAGYAVYYMTYNPQDARSTHNNYFDILAQTGFIGFAVFMAMMVAFGLTGWRAWRVVNGRRNFQEGYVAASLGGLAGVMTAMMLGDWVLPFAYNQTITGFDNASYTWLFLGGLVAVYQMLKKEGHFLPGKPGQEDQHAA